MTVDDEAACRALYDELVAGWNEGSGARFAAAFAEDGELVAFDGSRLQGRATIEAFHQELFDKWMKGTRLTGGVDDVKMLGPDVAVMHAIGGTIKKGKTTPSRARDSIQTLTLKADRGGLADRRVSEHPHPPDRQQLPRLPALDDRRRAVVAVPAEHGPDGPRPHLHAPAGGQRVTGHRPAAAV